MVYAAFTMMLRSVTKNSIATILGSLGVMFAMEIGLGIYEMVYSFQSWFPFGSIYRFRGSNYFDRSFIFES